MNKVLFGDCRASMRELIDDGVKVQMCVTSPPYWGLRDYGVDGQLGLEPTIWEYIDNLVEVFALVSELLNDDGVLWLNLGDSYARDAAKGQHKPKDQGLQKYLYQDGGGRASVQMNLKAQTGSSDRFVRRSDGTNVRNGGAIFKPKDLLGIPWRVAFALQQAGWYLRQDVIWHKPNPMPESVKDRCTKAHEYLFLLSKSERYYFDQEAIKEPVNGNSHKRGNGINPKAKIPSGWDTGPGAHRKRLGRYSAVKQNESFSAAISGLVNQRNKRSVWTVHTQPFKDAHFATFPPKLIEPCILATSKPGDIVLDPFYGSGTTGQVAQNIGRQYIGCELNEDYANMQAQRTAQQALVLD